MFYLLVLFLSADLLKNGIAVIQPADYDVRLVGSTNTEGVVEVYVDGSWRAICSNNFDLEAARVVCQQLGFPSAKVVTSSNGDGVSTYISYESIKCGTYSYTLATCKLQVCRSDICCSGIETYAGIICQDLEVRLVNGDTYSGIVEVNHGTDWGTICDDDWTLLDADIVCHTLGYPGSQRQAFVDEFEPSSGPVKCSKVDCAGSEGHLRECNPSISGMSSTCEPEKTIASVVCKKPFRLVNGTTDRKGRVEVFLNGLWGRVCDNGWGLDDANVLCNSLGFPGAMSAPVGSYFGEGVLENVLLEDLDCNGNESSILNCRRKTTVGDTCAHGHDASAICHDIDECVSQPCANGATCNNTVVGYVCICARGYEGTNCEDEIDECFSNPCKNQGTCQDFIDGYYCHCTPGFIGLICELNINECRSFPCTNGGTCIDDINGYSCNCMPGYNGIFCEHDIDECASSPCKNGSCIDELNGFQCQCFPGYTGLFCGIELNECSSNPCFNGAECVDLVNRYSCVCIGGYTGERCNEEINECDSDPCTHNGICNNELNRFTCDCSTGFHGDLCEIDTDECSSNPCKNNATCVNNIGSFSCTCRPGFIDVTCETNFNECSLNPCVRGTCLDLVNKYECVCPPGYFGDRCEVERDECLSFPCLNGECLDMVDGFNCTCHIGYEGILCDTEIDECLSNPCLHGGTCTDGVGRFACDCVFGFNGRLCEYDIDNCSNNPCFNGATCLDLVNSFQCTCAAGFTGDTCHTNIDECENNPCQHGGTCHDWINSYKCDCVQGYDGESCETNIDECQPQPCFNGGTCTDDVNAFTCHCPDGFDGSYCERNTDECLSNPCLNDGQCIDGNGFYTCACQNGYFGKTCQLGGIRLINGTSPYDGRVEVSYNNQWGTICGTSWDLNDARVVCRQIDTPGAIRTYGVSSPYGPGSGPIILDQVDCTGYEETLGDCGHSELGINNCNHQQDVGVHCMKGVRLVGGGNALEGVVEVFWNGEWGTICDDDWGIDDALVVCRELGFTGALQAVDGGSQFGYGSGDILLDNVACLGTESRLINCGHTQPGVNHCTQNDHAGVICLNSSSVRLVGGDVPYEGRVEVNLSGEWGTVCDDSWGILDAQVVCRQLGYPNVVSAPCRAMYGQGTGDIVMNNVDCSGQETQLVECPRNSLNLDICGHHKDASAVCENNIRLVDGNKETEGRVEVFLDGRWGTVCDDDFDIDDAHVVCRHLGFWEALTFYRNSRFGVGSIPVILDNLRCNGNESRISECPHLGIGVHNCQNSEDVSVVCNLKVRLAEGAIPSEGRVEVYAEGAWGTVCDDSWDRNDGDVVCKELGYERAERVTVTGSFGQGTGNILLDNVGCTGAEHSLGNCSHNGLGVHNCAHYEDAGVICFTNDVVRLVGGSGQNEGRVEIYHNGEWGTVCDDGWGIPDATVVCRQLGYTEAIEAPGRATYGAGSNLIWLDDVNCSGTESSIFDCNSRDIGSHNCNHGEDAGAVCIGNSKIRLVGGTLENEGRVEILRNGQWGTVCDDGWDQNEATVVCRQLDFPGALSSVAGAEFGEGIGPIHLSRVQCNGNERRLDLCDHVGQTSSCGHHNDAGVYCMPRVQLVGGVNSGEGRVEYYYNHAWGTVCDDNWERVDANVVCKELGFGSAVEATTHATFGAGSGRIHLNDVDCSGMETNLAACDHSEWGQHNCNHNEDAGVRCGLAVRLVGGATALEGRVEIFYQGKWGTVCDDSWGVEDAAVVCNSLSYTGPSEAFSRAYFGQGSGPILLDNVACVGTETGLNQCPSNRIGIHNCGHHEDAGVRCSASASIRLVGGNNEREGRVEVYAGGRWGTICDDGWGINDANVVCRQLGYIGAIDSHGSAHFGQGTSSILLDNVVCIGTESTILECNHNGLGSHNCQHSEDAGVTCLDGEPVRLQDGSTPNEGRVEILHNGVWGTVCDDSWSISDGTVVCKQLGYPGAVRVRTNAFWGQGTGPIHLDDVGCNGDETSILDCSHAGLGIENCGHNEDAGVECIKSVRLAGGVTHDRGRVEVFVDGAWGTVCDDSWDLNDANVVCRELGYESASDAKTSAFFGPGTGNINLDEVCCAGDEHSLLECDHAGSRVHDCDHNEDAGVVCTNSIAVRLVGGNNDREGRVEIQIQGIWGTICDDSWGLQDATVICRQLGLGRASSAPCNAHFGQGTGQIHLDDVHCLGTESSIIDCPHGGIGSHNCQHAEDAGVVCSQTVNVRLAGSFLPGWGRVEILRHGVWGTICNDQWDHNNARVICRMLGYPWASHPLLTLPIAPGRGQIWLDNVNCIGTELNIADCPHRGWGVHNCLHNEDVYVSCYY
ncbi:scavenger receptor cysteine-rich domain-containing protein DMBT1-like isoform X1 [Antedon mediterranea]|uniref:scavenger receptor cysteine-rich domain-containing protein DMBT1-like isoform X1 n=1 Tax=Antedon mediterranea TaxID=105859 RepID=UPI003AF55F84